jgi:uncharacterized membrane protein
MIIEYRSIFITTSCKYIYSSTTSTTSTFAVKYHSSKNDYYVLKYKQYKYIYLFLLLFIVAR